MKTTIKENILRKLALVAFISTMGSYTYANHCETGIDNIISVFIPAERNLADFFNSSIKTPFKTFVEEFDKILRDFRRKTEDIKRGHEDELSALTDEITDYVAQHFNVLCNILKKYNGKSASYAADFSVEIKREFNTDKIFGEIINKLKVLRNKAQADKALVKKIDCLMQLIQKKKNEWSAKPDLMLFAGLTYRMKC